MKLVDFGGGGYGAPMRRGLVSGLAPVNSTLLWALRRMALMQPLGAARCHAVQVALHRQFGDDGLAVEHLLRCILVGLARVSTRCLVIGEPGCGLVMADEAVLLALAGGSADAGLLEEMAGTQAAGQLLPLFAALSALTGK